MAYDPNDPADKATVDALIEAAVEAERETHAAEVTRLDGKNKDLLKKLTRLRAGGDDATATGEIEQLERQLEENGRELATAKGELREATRKLKAAEVERDTFKTQAEKEGNFSRTMLTENALTDALVTAKVAPHFMDAAKALLSKGVAVEVNGDERTVTANGKTVAEYVNEWATSDAGKHYVLAPGNAGGGLPNANGGGGGGGKALKDMTEAERLEMNRTNPAGFQALVEADQSGNQSIAA